MVVSMFLVVSNASWVVFYSFPSGSLMVFDDFEGVKFQGQQLQQNNTCAPCIILLVHRLNLCLRRVLEGKSIFDLAQLISGQSKGRDPTGTLGMVSKATLQFLS